MVSAAKALDVVRDRLRADLCTRFPGLRLDLRFGEEGLVCQVHHPAFGSSSATLWVEEDDEYTEADVARLLYDVTFQVAFNLWPDELDDPWPLCPAHEPHPLEPQLHHGRAVWLCLHDRRTSIDIGSLPGTGHVP